MIDGDYVDPLAGSGLTADDHGEESWAGDSPWEDPDAERPFEDKDDAAKKKGEASYREDLDGTAQGLEDDPRRADVDDFYLNEDSGRQRVQVSSWGISGPVDWVNLHQHDPRLDEPFPWEPGAQTDPEAAPVGMGVRWEAVSGCVEFLWGALRPPNPVISGFGYDEYELAQPEIDVIYDITLRLVDDETFQPDSGQVTEAERAVRLAQRRIFGEETRGGARERGAAVRAKRRFPHGHLSGPYFYYDFTTRSHGRGKAGRDTPAIREWLGARLVERHGRRWIIGDDGPFTIEEYRRAVGRGGPKSAEQRPAYGELAMRVRELRGDGASQTAISEVTGIHVNTIRKIAKP